MTYDPVTRAEFDALVKSQADTHAKVSAMHQALMVSAPPHEKSLVQRMAEVTVRVESGDRVLAGTLRVAAFLAAIGAIAAALRFGAHPPQ